MSKEEMKQQVLAQFETKVAQLKAEIEALRSIRRLSKKDGSDFANIHKNFASSEYNLFWRTPSQTGAETLAITYTYDTSERKGVYGTTYIEAYALENTGLFDELKEKGLEVS